MANKGMDSAQLPHNMEYIYAKRCLHKGAYLWLSEAFRIIN